MDHILQRRSTRQGINFQTLPRTPMTEYAAGAWFAKGAIPGPFLDEMGCSWTRLKPQTPRALQRWSTRQGLAFRRVRASRHLCKGGPQLPAWHARVSSGRDWGSMGGLKGMILDALDSARPLPDVPAICSRIITHTATFLGGFLGQACLWACLD